MLSGKSNFKIDKAVIQGTYRPVWSCFLPIPRSTQMGNKTRLASDKADTAFPQGIKLIQAEQYGHSASSSTARLTAQNEDGPSSDFFLKVGGKKMSHGFHPLHEHF